MSRLGTRSPTRFLYSLLVVVEAALEPVHVTGPFEGFVAAEVVKRQVNKGFRKEIYHYRDEHGLEVDFIVPGKNSGISLLECRSTRTPVPSMASAMLRVRDVLKEKQETKRPFDLSLVYPAPPASSPASLGNGAKAMDLATWLSRAR